MDSPCMSNRAHSDSTGDGNPEIDALSGIAPAEAHFAE